MVLKAPIYCMKAVGGHASIIMGGFGGKKKTEKVTGIAFGNLGFLVPYGLGNYR